MVRYMDTYSKVNGENDTGRDVTIYGHVHSKVIGDNDTGRDGTRYGHA